jgi:hypothetical protein
MTVKGRYYLLFNKNKHYNLLFYKSNANGES